MTLKKRFWHNLIWICLILFAIRLYVDNNVIEVSKYEVSFENLPKAFDGTVILHISDLHSKVFGLDNEQLYTKIREIDPDYIMLTGDMINATDTNYDVFFELAKEICSEYETYFIVGNHELALSNEEYGIIENTITDYGIKILDNKTITLTKDDESINLHGMWFNSKYYFGDDFNLEVMEKIMGIDEGGFDILLTHNPKYKEVYAEWGAEFTLTGHVHGGMVRIPYAGGVFSPERTLFPKYDNGIYTTNSNHMLVSRGLGRGLNGFRLFNQPELGMIILKSK